MPYTVTTQERQTSQSGQPGDRGRIYLEYVAKGSPNYSDVLTQVLTDAPAVFQGLVRFWPDIKAERIDDANSIWTVSVPYVPVEFQPKSTGFQYYRLNVVEGTKHVKHGIATRSYASPMTGGKTNTFGGAINPRDVPGGKMEVDGVDIGDSTVYFDIGWVFAPADVTTTYLSTVIGLRQKTNSNTFWGCNSGEARFVGATIEKRGTGNWEANFRFAANGNVSGQSIPDGGGGNITGVAVGGWEYGYPIFNTYTNSYTYELSPLMPYFNVSQVYQSGDFTGLAIGTNFPTGAIGP